jgi:phospholipid transport system substrate-binding protein
MSKGLLVVARCVGAICMIGAMGRLTTAAPACAEEPDRSLAAQTALATSVERLSSILQDDGASPDDRRAGITAVLDPWLDVPFITRSALGRNADTLTRDQTTEVATEMKRYVIATWLQRIARANVDHFEILGATLDEDTGVVVVQTRGGRRIVTNPRNSGRPDADGARVDYRLHERGGRWRIRTMVIDDVDVVRVFREQFDAILRRDDPGALIERMREVNDRLEARNPFAANPRRTTIDARVGPSPPSSPDGLRTSSQDRQPARRGRRA